VVASRHAAERVRERPAARRSERLVHHRRHARPRSLEDRHAV